ncbi:nuclear pore complex subunit Nup192, putative [Talaromyces stipitatus ATCC 10500]|uniref:Nuclear pore complex subunit Nup192, putative n=1 Tax=Talaromyces stipitatus (strain ATCC 10500 / CBS 375.48 / QM 6759 / NRRL 1006) TaxID=441959 RepID=B8LSU8_TALSN|nr:nuclear pore complex subunit Nup192, putative [Talaromyces stipitatus ATCC 10500]EED22944.1 nuclear pore complex subunit Nup192, putative [Talaromyces stipitatus ATCC 10500]
MDGIDSAGGLRGLFQDLSAITEPSMVNIERLCFELESHLQDFRTLLDKPSKNDNSRKSVLSGKVKIDNVEYAINEDFQQNTLQLADALNLDEVEAAGLFMAAQEAAQQLDRTPLVAAIIKFHERRHFLLECLRLIFQESFDVEREEIQELMQNMVGHILQTKEGTFRNASLFARKCLATMEDIEKWLTLIADQIQKISIVGQAEDADITEAFEHQRTSLMQQHESLGATLCYLFKGTYTSSEDLRFLLDRMRKIERVDLLLVHYLPAIIAALIQYGSPSGSGTQREARSLHLAIISKKDNSTWALVPLHAAVISLWLSVYSGWYFDSGPASPLQGVDFDKEAEERTTLFKVCLDEGALEFMLAVCASVQNDEWSHPARNELVNLLLKDSPASVFEADSVSDFMKPLLMEHFDTFTESCIANMPNAVRMLKADEDAQRLDQITALRDGLSSSLHRGVLEARTHLETFLVIMAFAFEGRHDPAQEFWADPDGNLYGFVQWASKRQTVPRVSAFCEMLCSISEGEDNAASAHKFLSEEDKQTSVKFRRSPSMNWAQMFAELQLYATKVTEKPSTSSHVLHTRKAENIEMNEPESPVMLTCYLQLIGHLSKQNKEIRNDLLGNPSYNVVSTLLTLCSGSIPTHLRASAFSTLKALMTDRTSSHGNDMWLALDQWISGAAANASGLTKAPILSNQPAWHERHAFQKIGESFDQTNCFVDLVHTLVTPVFDRPDKQLALPFPEALGASYRMPGIEPYIDFVLGHAFARKVPDVPDSQGRLLALNCLNFIATCLTTFNEDLVGIAHQPSANLETGINSSDLNNYIRLHPFARVFEWLFNEDVLKTLFLSAKQDPSEVLRAHSESVLVQSLEKTLEVMNLILNHQSTYLNIVRPVLRNQGVTNKVTVANSALASFEDSILNNLYIIPALCLYCGTGHQVLTHHSMSLLQKLSSSRKLNKSAATGLMTWKSPNRIVEVLSTEVDADVVSRPLVYQMQPDPRELDHGPTSPGYLIRDGLLALLDSCLATITDRPNIAHLLLGFSCVSNTLDVNSEGLFAQGMSLLHSVIEFIQTYPTDIDGNILSWAVHSKRMAFQVLKHLWSSKLSSAFVLTELRMNRFLMLSFANQPIINFNTIWDGFPSVAPEFWLSPSSSGLMEFLAYRSLLYEYATTEVRAASKLGSQSLQLDVLSTLLGMSLVENGETLSHATVFDLFDFADLKLSHGFPIPQLHYLEGVDFDICAKEQPDSSVVLYDLDAAQQLIELRKKQLTGGSQVRSQEEEQFKLEAEQLTDFLRVTNMERQIHYNRYLAIRSWAELVTTMAISCDMEEGRRRTFILQAISLITPKLEGAMVDNVAEAIQLAQLAETLISKLDSSLSPSHQGRGGDLIDEKLYQLVQISIRGICSSIGDVSLRESFYNICAHYISRITTTPGSIHQNLRRQCQLAVKASGVSLVEAVSDDAYAGQDTCKVSAILLLNLLAELDAQEHSHFLAETISQSNYLNMFLDSIKTLSSEFRDAQAHDIPLLISYYHALLSLLQKLCQTKLGATLVLNTGLFAAIRESRLFAADPDIGIDMDNPDALRNYYELLASMLRVIVSAVFSRSVHNEQIMDQTRNFLTENRSSMVGIFKRSAKIGGEVSSNHCKVIQNLVKAYVALITAAGFVEQNPTPSGHQSSKRGAAGKRKSVHEDLQQRNISELFSSSGNQQQQSSSSAKRLRTSISPSRSSRDKLSSADKMYNFSTSSQSPKAAEKFSKKIGGPTVVSRPSNFTPHTGAKRLVVKNLRSGPRLNQDEYFDDIWTRLSATLDTIFDGGKPAASLEELYKGAENVCRQGRAESLAKKLQERCKTYIVDNLRQNLVDKTKNASNIDTLRAVVDAWAVWNTKLVTIRWMFYYLDQSFLLHSKDYPVINEMGLNQFQTHIFLNEELKPKILQGACDLIAANRASTEDKSQADSDLLRKAISLFHDLGVYTRHFERLFLSESEEFLKTWSKKESQIRYLGNYAENCHRLIEQELTQCELYALNRNTQQSLSALFDEYLVRDKEYILLSESDLKGLMTTENKHALERIYSLLERVKLGDRLKPAFSKYIEEQGATIVFDTEREAEMVVRLLNFKQKLDDTWTESFHKDETLGHTLREAFEHFMNMTKKTEASWGTDNSKTGEMIAKYVDMLLKGGLKVIGKQAEDTELADEDTEINKQLDKVLDLFRFVHGKAVFEAFYKNDLARRLLMGRSASDDAEKSMLARLKTECGSSFTHNLEAMFRDMDLARDEMSSYNAYKSQRRDKLNLDLSVNVLSAAAWPTYPDVLVRIPPDIAKAISDFEQYYHTKHNGRKLSWKHQLAHCQLRSRFDNGNKEIVVSSFQAIVLLLFNDVSEGETLSYGQIKEATGLSDRELKRTLQSLACAKYRVLTKKPKGKDVNETDQFAYNNAFQDPKMRIKINQIQLKETKEENKTTHERVAADRHYETQAAIVRIMKSRKTITHAELVAEVIKATRSRGVLEPAEIKKNIEKLIEKDYMEREEGNRYSYLA